MATSIKRCIIDNDKQIIFNMTHTLLQQLVNLLETFLGDNRAYIKASNVMPGGTIGKHTRHIYDHFQLLLPPHPGTHAEGQWIVDFDARSRDHPMESFPDKAIENLREIQRRLKSSELSTPLKTPLVLAATVGSSDTVPKYHIESTFERELWYCCMHAIHHYASIKAICIENGIPVNEDFGVAPSTILYHQHRKLNDSHHRL
ncbi:hypothetical protein BX666DRAFT_1997159 [Dichotomocladium elegans]|nr:hypothetical protein BX666DRAFT_1997159 [Dichotomocladium elegans]